MLPASFTRVDSDQRHSRRFRPTFKLRLLVRGMSHEIEHVIPRHDWWGCE